MPLTYFPAATFPLFGWSHIAIVGADARTFLQSFCTNDILKLSPGQGCEAFLPDIKGKIVAHVLVFNEPNAIRLVSVPHSSETIVAHLRKYLLGIQAEVHDLSGDSSLLCLAGSEINDILMGTLGVALPEQIGNHVTVETAEGPVLIGRVPFTCMPSVILLGGPEAITALRDEWPDDVVSRGTPEFFEMLRIEAGFPWHGRDIGPDTIAQEAARTQQTISFKKGCYLGQEPIARLDAMGHTNKELRCLVIDGANIAAGSELRLNGEPVGTITSATPSSQPGKTVALGMIRTRGNAPGTVLTALSEGRECRAAVHWPHIGSLD